MIGWPSSAGVCQACGKWAVKRYGGEGRYPAVCLPCWLSDAKLAELLNRGKP